MTTQEPSKKSVGRPKKTTTSKASSAKVEHVPSVKVEFVDEHAARLYENKVPSKGSSGASGLDLRYTGTEPQSLSHLIPQRFKAGVRMEIPEGYEVQIRSRSGLSAQGLVVTNSPGTVDSDYRGEIELICHTLNRSYIIRPGDRIAQAVLVPVGTLQWTLGEVDQDTDRGSNGFGSTGVT